eukprot:CAMPEP_0181111136 /NCGR_PEP_ID=MMETSP1071-20121207/19107_1 /TAXON_ID=35127 /ORGANISM="Thalassiosira sp., Strain NH16" /LENGTH=601 /DNA_ID=CAMNT_0023194995 /DNA_START=15 /DNA_END=1817 /DNA_ORIENTATION=+
MINKTTQRHHRRRSIISSSSLNIQKWSFHRKFLTFLACHVLLLSTLNRYINDISGVVQTTVEAATPSRQQREDQQRKRKQKQQNHRSRREQQRKQQERRARNEQRREQTQKRKNRQRQQNQQRQQQQQQQQRRSNFNRNNQRQKKYHQQQRQQRQSNQKHNTSNSKKDSNDYYKILNVNRGAKPKEIKSAYRKLALKYHPDKFQSDPKLSEKQNEAKKKKHGDNFIKVASAYDILGDTKKRMAFDSYGQNGLDMLEKGIDPEAAGFGAGNRGSSGHAPRRAQQQSSGTPFGGSDSFGGGARGGFGGGFPGFQSFFGGMPGMGRQQQKRQQTKPKDKPPPALFGKDDPSGVVPLGSSKFPDTRSKHAWLILFYDRGVYQKDKATKGYVSRAKQLSEGLLKRAQNVKNGMIFKVGAVDCGGDAPHLRFCKSKLGKDVGIPAFATVLNGSIDVIADGGDDSTLRTVRQLRDHTTNSLLNIDGLVVNVNSVQHIQSRLLASSPSPTTTAGHPVIAIVLLTDKYETSPLYASLAYRHRQDGFAAFGESRGKNLSLAKQFSAKKYPTLVAIIGNIEKTEWYDGNTSLDSESLSKWVDGLSKKYFKSR